MTDAATTATTAEGATAAAAATTATTTTAAAPWYGDKIDAVTLGFWQNKGIDAKDPVAVASKLTEFYRNSEKLIGAPPEEMLRVPRPNADSAELKQFYGRLGVPAEPKDYDLSAVKFSDGSELDQGFSDTIRGVLHNARVPGDRAADVVKALVKIEEDSAKAEHAQRTTRLQEQNAKLETNWGNNFDMNMFAARAAFEKTALAAGLTQEQVTEELGRVFVKGKVENAAAMEMWRILAQRMGEAPFITGGATGQSGPMSRESALAEIESLKKDRDWYGRWYRGDKEARTQWDNLHKIAFGRAA